jgi:hypothetical protein
VLIAARPSERWAAQFVLEWQRPSSQVEYPPLDGDGDAASLRPRPERLVGAARPMARKLLGHQDRNASSTST